MSLEQIAAEMKSYALDNPLVSTSMDMTNYQRQLSGGLHLTLVLTFGSWRLSLARQNTTPSATEIAVCRRTFQVPETALLERPQAPGDWKVVRLSWPPQGQLFTLEAA